MTKERVEVIQEFEHVRILRVDNWKCYVQSKETNLVKGGWKTARTAIRYGKGFDKDWNEFKF